MTFQAGDQEVSRILREEASNFSRRSWWWSLWEATQIFQESNIPRMKISYFLVCVCEYNRNKPNQSCWSDGWQLLTMSILMKNLWKCPRKGLKFTSGQWIQYNSSGRRESANVCSSVKSCTVGQGWGCWQSQQLVLEESVFWCLWGWKMLACTWLRIR